MTTKAEWIAVDWGTSRLRAWAMDADDAVLARLSSPRGMNSLKRDEFEGALIELVGGHLADARTTPVICCGMVGARQGWKEAPYSSLPFGVEPGEAATVAVPASDPRIAPTILGGVRQNAPPDVMRGEETQIIGFLAENPDFEGAVCLPGTHTKWARVQNGKIVEFQTFMTGELFSLLAERSVLRHGMSDSADTPINAHIKNDADTPNSEEFASMTAKAMNEPHLLLARLFGLRADALLNGLAPAAARARLSGLLIGAELAAARRFHADGAVALVAEAALGDLYAGALKSRGVAARAENAGAMTLRGITTFFNKIRETRR
ncbi:MAG: 2-dehydro-3-deoxygalactonokinase [Alphaproteobacteria bacterium]|nr:2-dehydro-3-deoxygalactonokinase [Alphaproteobacteria bacterium]